MLIGIIGENCSGKSTLAACIRDLDHTEMTNQYFSDYNQRDPEHSMKASAGVCYVLAVRKK